MGTIPKSDNHFSAPYNMKALVRCEANYLGAALPTKTTQPPGIIHEPLGKICSGENLSSAPSLSKKPVKLFIFHSGIIIEIMFGKHAGDLVWYPIKNLYCSAGLQPLKTKHGTFEFKSLDDNSKSSLKPIFALVIRETVHRRVLQCHAFSVVKKEVAQLLVQATALAYRDKSGWDLPLNTDIFGVNNYKYTLNITDDVQLDSGYSDHEESSRDQSPQSSELSAPCNKPVSPTDNSATRHTSDTSQPSDRIKVTIDNVGSSKAGSKPTTPKLCIPTTVVQSQNRLSVRHSTDSKSSSSAQSSPSIAPKSSSKPKRQVKQKSAARKPKADKNANTYQGFESDSLYPPEAMVTTKDQYEAPSESSGYPLSRVSSVSGLTSYHKMSPDVVVIQKVSSPKVKHSAKHPVRGSAGDSDSTLSGSSSKCRESKKSDSISNPDESDQDRTLRKDSENEISPLDTRKHELKPQLKKRDRRHTENSHIQIAPDSRNNLVPTQQYLRSISLDDYHRMKSGYGQPPVRYLRTPPPPLMEIIDIDGVPTRVVHHNYEPHQSWSPSCRTSSPFSSPEVPVFVPEHHPEQFMYDYGANGYPSISAGQYYEQPRMVDYRPQPHKSALYNFTGAHKVNND